MMLTGDNFTVFSLLCNALVAGVLFTNARIIVICYECTTLASLFLQNWDILDKMIFCFGICFYLVAPSYAVLTNCVFNVFRLDLFWLKVVVQLNYCVVCSLRCNKYALAVVMNKTIFESLQRKTSYIKRTSNN